LVMGSQTAFGNGPVSLAAGKFQLGGNFPIINPVNLTGGTTGVNNGIVVFTGANPFVFNNTVTLSNGTTTVQAPTAVTINGVLAGGNNLALQSGTVTLTAANTTTGQIVVAGGNLVLSGPNGRLGGTNAVNAVQTITFGGTITGGTFTLSFNGLTTGPITWSATAATLQTNIQNALLALPNIGTGNVAVAGPRPFTITFRGAL